MEKSIYIEEAHRQLSDINFFAKQSVNLTGHFSDKIMHTMSENKETDDDTFECLYPTNATNCRTPQIYQITRTKVFTCFLQMNNFEFCDEQYLQVGGTAMGMCLAPSYAKYIYGTSRKDH